jgi:large subunit ribosomal protein L25
VLEKGKKVRVSVPLHFEGVAGAVKNLGGILVKVMHEIEVEAEPHDLPHAITVNVEGLENFESQIHVRDIVIPKGLIIIDGGEEVVAAVSQPREEKEEEAAPVDLSAIEVEKKGKKDLPAQAGEEGAEGAEGTKDKAAPEK